MPSSKELTVIPIATLNEAIVFIGNHRGITYAEAEPVIRALTQHGNAGMALYKELAAPPAPPVATPPAAAPDDAKI